jgi:hypothetical protein
MPKGFRFPGGARGEDSLGTETAQRRTHTQRKPQPRGPWLEWPSGSRPSPNYPCELPPLPPPPSESTPVNKHTYLQLGMGRGSE